LSKKYINLVPHRWIDGDSQVLANTQIDRCLDRAKRLYLSGTKTFSRPKRFLG
jgi:hypothetical protein